MSGLRFPAGYERVESRHGRYGQDSGLVGDIDGLPRDYRVARLFRKKAPAGME